jgi:hypothetical protein
VVAAAVVIAAENCAAGVRIGASAAAIAAFAIRLDAAAGVAALAFASDL